MKTLKNFLRNNWNRIQKDGKTGKISFVLLGIVATIWFLIRVIPKPSRAAYPCMKATAPIASSFVAYLIGITSITFFYRRAKSGFLQSKNTLAFTFLFIGLIAGIWTIYHTNFSVKASEPAMVQAGNEPIGVAKGVFPGRVVWVFDADATDKSCSNTTGDYWSSDENADQDVISDMLTKGLKNLTGATTNAAVWDSIFRYYNRTHGKGNKGYTAGEKIVIKINLNGIHNIWSSTPPKNVNTSPQVCYAILNELIASAGVPQANISIGDPNCPMDDITYKKCSDAYPKVIYWGNGSGRTTANASAGKVLISSSDDLSFHFENKLPQAYLDAAYMINIPVLKKHHRAGISLSSKNHFGSVAPYSDKGGAGHLHISLPCPDASGVVSNGEYGQYRCFVDIMGHKDLGGKTILYLIDGIWGSTNWGHPPVKWRMAPFNNDWPSSLFLSQDPVAIESVGYDFLFNEFDETHPTEGEFVGDDKGPFAQFAGTDDFLHQAADKDNWAAGVTYDPENDGSELGSLGTHEHWNNATDKKYSRNLNAKTGKGIELYSGGIINPVINTTIENKIAIYPNPATDFINISANDIEAKEIFLVIRMLDGKELYSAPINVNSHSVSENIPLVGYAPGTYVATLAYNGNIYSKVFIKSNR